MIIWVAISCLTFGDYVPSMGAVSRAQPSKTPREQGKRAAACLPDAASAFKGKASSHQAFAAASLVSIGLRVKSQEAEEIEGYPFCVSE